VIASLRPTIPTSLACLCLCIHARARTHTHTHIGVAVVFGHREFHLQPDRFQQVGNWPYEKRGGDRGGGEGEIEGGFACNEGVCVCVCVCVCVYVCGRLKEVLLAMKEVLLATDVRI
jgi:hypothetical protein